MQVFLSAPDFDPVGFVEFDAAFSTKTGDSRRRVNRIATLDGGSVVNDFGFTESDRTVELKWISPSAAYDSNIVRMVQTYQELQLAIRDGVFAAVPDTYSPPSGGSTDSTLTLLITRKISG